MPQNGFYEGKGGILRKDSTLKTFETILPRIVPAQRKIAILLHENDRYPRANGYFIWALCNAWRERGIEIEVIKGTGKPTQADVLIPHVDTTILPEAYGEFLQRHPRVLNRSVPDISKRFVSRNLLKRTDAYDGQVIVKTNLNCGGGPEAELAASKIFFSTGNLKNLMRGWVSWKRKKFSSDWGAVNCMKCEDYQIFPSLKAVPEKIFENPWLVVEKFLPECENGVYYLRIYKFFGDRGYCARFGSPHAIVKQKNIVSREDIPIPDEVVTVRQRLGMDYGKLDFVVYEGRVIVFDVNRTPGIFNPLERMRAKAVQLAPGIESFF